MSAAFDGSGYRRRVLAPLRARTPVDTADPYLVADLDPLLEHTDSEVAAQLARVMAFLQRERNSAKYAALATELVRRRGEWEAPLLDGDARARLRHTVLDARRNGDAERLAKVDGYLVTLRDRFGGIPASRVAGLRRLAAAAGVTGAEFDARLGREVIIADGGGAGVEALAPEVRSQIRQRLEDLRVLRGGDRAGTASLWDFLGLPPEAGPDRIRSAWEAVAAGNARRPHDREKTLTADLLAMVRSRLVEGDPAAYTAGLLADVADELRPIVEEHVVLDGELTAVAYEGLVRAALAAGRGLGAEQAKTVILGIARNLGAAVSTGGAVDYVLCPGCGRPEPVGGSRTCRYCDAGLYTTCPGCASLTEAAAVTCRRCGYSLRQVRAAGDALAAVRQALEAGRPREASDGLARVRAAVAAAGSGAGNGTAEAADELESLVRAGLGAAEAGWRALAEERSTLRSDAAVERARWLVARAADVPGPDGRPPAEVLGELTAQQAVIRRRVEAARGLPPEQQEAALVAVLATAVDSADALRALAALPLRPPTDLTSVLADDAVLLRWRPSASAGPVTYRVERVAVDPGSGQLTRRGLGTTSSTELADAGAPPWTPVRHEVTALSGERRSRPVSTAPVIAVRDVADLRAEATPTGVRLTWRPSGPSDTVTIERTVDPDSSVSAPPRRARVTGGSFLDSDVLPGVGYRYRAFVEYTDVDGSAARTSGSRAEFGLLTRPRPVTDLVVGAEDGQVALRWTPRSGAEVRVYATAVPPSGGAVGALHPGGPGADGSGSGANGAGGYGAGAYGSGGHGTGVLGAGAVSVGAGEFGRGPEPSSGPLVLLGGEGAEVPLAALTPPLRLVGASRQGHLRDAAVPLAPGTGELIYTPVTVVGGLGVLGRSAPHRFPVVTHDVSEFITGITGITDFPTGNGGHGPGNGGHDPASAGLGPAQSTPPGHGDTSPGRESLAPGYGDVPPGHGGTFPGHAGGPPAGGPPLPPLPAVSANARPVMIDVMPSPEAVPAPGGAPLVAPVLVGPSSSGGSPSPLDPSSPVGPPVAEPSPGVLPSPGVSPVTGAQPSPGAQPFTGGLPFSGAQPAPGTPPVPGLPPETGALPIPGGPAGPGGSSTGGGTPGTAGAPVGPPTVGMPLPVAPDESGAHPSAGTAPARPDDVEHPVAPAVPGTLSAGQEPGPGPGPGPGSGSGALAAPPLAPAHTQGHALAPGPSAPVGSPAQFQPPVPAPAELTSITYSVSKAGWRRRTLRVQVRATGPAPRLVLLARPGEEPPGSPAEGQVLAELQPAPSSGSWTMEVTLEGAQLPWGVRLLPVVTPGAPAVWIDHPEDPMLVVR
ncbi:zinc ribbon domain-containing protein [Frankia sp. Mgl5]|uniref:zinc ribbon domain-containing protein n=1 Tax=Frankia sp. Mgl5 TaxID=2933793 RepID=UPI00200F6C2A|nr:zinc ribbon domain-containing protein [Frankia sp. Mgl5]MCK9930532.1 zinc ribbon domain-containing protein [Frankia sp. Mgl5]